MVCTWTSHECRAGGRYALFRSQPFNSHSSSFSSPPSIHFNLGCSCFIDRSIDRSLKREVIFLFLFFKKKEANCYWNCRRNYMYGNSIRILNNDRGTVVTSSRWIIRCPINAVLIPLDVEFNRFYVRFPSRLFVLDASQYVYCTITR